MKWDYFITLSMGIGSHLRLRSFVVFDSIIYPRYWIGGRERNIGMSSQSLTLFIHSANRTIMARMNPKRKAKRKRKAGPRACRSTKAGLRIPASIAWREDGSIRH